MSRPPSCYYPSVQKLLVLTRIRCLDSNHQSRGTVQRKGPKKQWRKCPLRQPHRQRPLPLFPFLSHPRQSTTRAPQPKPILLPLIRLPAHPVRSPMQAIPPGSVPVIECIPVWPIIHRRLNQGVQQTRKGLATTRKAARLRPSTPLCHLLLSSSPS